MKKYLQKNLLTSVSVLVIFLCFFHITYLTPMQCDDFWYYKIGLNPNKHINHYLHWSGRIIADYFSCALLQIPSHAVSSAIISFFATGICYFIVKIPTVVNPDYKVSWWKLMVTAALYWISNPQIEDSTFWVVGACNYVVTTFLVFMFLYFFLKNRNSFSWCLAILSIAAGCSNENTCLAIIYTLLVLLLISHFKKINSLTIDVKLNKKFFLIYSALFVIGALILILSPGNFERLQQGVCRNWCELFFDQKIDQFIDNSQRNLSNMGRAWKFYILSLGMAAILWKKNQKQIAWSLLFFSTATVSYIVMAISPYFPGRALNSTLCFLLLAISFLADLSLLRYKTLKIILITTIAYVLWLFVKFFAILSVGHQSVMIQDAIRIDHIKYEKGKRGRHITVDIPQHYISTLLRRYDISFPFEFIPYPMEATWNGVDELNHIPVKYDYAVLKMGKNLPVDNQTDMKDIKVYFQSKSWLVPQSTIILESSDPICNGLIFFYKNGNNQKQIELNEQTIELQGKYYTGITIENTLDLKEAIIKISTKNYDE